MKRLFFKQQFVVIFCGQIAAFEVMRCQSGPVEWRKNAPDEFGLYVVLEELRLEIRKDSVFKQTVIGRGKAAAGDRADPVDLIQQAAFFPIDDYMGLGQGL